MNRKLNQIILLIIAGIFVSVAVVVAGNKVIESFKASSIDNNVKIEWRTADESGISYFEIQRSTTNNIFKTISTVPARGSSTTYSYTDSDGFMKDSKANEMLAKGVVSYRIKMIYGSTSSSKEEYSDEVIVTHEVGSAKRTWGMIKEMFK